MLKRSFLAGVLCIAATSAYSLCSEHNRSCSLFSISPTFGYYQYKEPGLMSIKGPSFGLQLDYQQISRNGMVLFVNAELGFVNGKYDGRLNDNEQTPFTMNNDNSYILGISPRLGYQFLLYQQQLALTPYAGLGYRFLHNGTSDNQYGYLRISNYFYLPLGVQLTLNKGHFMMQSQLEFDVLPHGIQYSGVDGGVYNQQDRGFGANANILFGQDESSWAWLVGPYVKYWKIPDSKAEAGNTYTWKEPKNNTLDIGLMAKFIF